MAYCEGAKEARIIYKFADKSGTYIVKEEYFPFDVETKSNNGYIQNFFKEYDGSSQGTYNFVIPAPDNIPQNIGGQPEIYLLSGTWDDYGSVGTYQTGEGVVKGFSGRVKVGEGYSVSGSVINKLPARCYATITVEFAFNTCQLIVKSKGREIFSITGECPVKFEVACDNDCPPNHIRCQHKAYPGYCCVSCADFNSAIDKARSKLR